MGDWYRIEQARVMTRNMGSKLKDASRELGAMFNVSPINNIREARSRLDYFAAFALAVAYIEYYTFGVLRKRLDKKAINKLKRKGASILIEELLSKDKNREELYENIKRVIRERNKLIHSKDKIYNKYEYDEKRESLLDLTIECINELMDLV